MAQIVCEELGAKWSDMRVQLASNDPKFNDPVLGAQITGGSWSTMMKRTFCTLFIRRQSMRMLASRTTSAHLGLSVRINSANSAWVPVCR